jgi:HlyD family type I secretion membrane fusion protein
VSPGVGSGKTAEKVPAVKTRAWPWVVAGGTVIALAFGGMGGWAATVPLASAIIAKGHVTVDTNRKHVQHLEGGIVADLRVRDGDVVKENEVLIRLDDTRAKASLAIVASAYREELAKEARYIAERDEKDTIEWPEDLRNAARDPALTALLTSQQAIFESRRETLRGETDILGERIRQLEEEIEGLTAQKAASEKQIELINEELKGLLDLYSRGQTTRPRILALQREAARLEGERGELIGKVARSRKAVGETKLEIIQKQKAFRNEVVSALRDVQAKVNDLRERFVAAQDVLERIDIRAPVAGKIVGLAVHSNGSVIKPAETILEIVPSDDRLLIEVQVEPQDIDNVAVRQEAEVRMLAFKQRTTPTLKGRVSYVSADALKNAQTGATFYLARIEVPETELKRLESQALQPGMPAQAMIQTGKRTAIAYMVQPILDSINRAWRER